MSSNAVVIEPKGGEHTHTVILLHSMYNQGSDFADVPNCLELLGARPEDAGGIKYIFPNAPKRAISWPAGTEHNVSAWYNYYTDMSGEDQHDEIDESQLD